MSRRQRKRADAYRARREQRKAAKRAARELPDGVQMIHMTPENVGEVHNMIARALGETP